MTGEFDGAPSPDRKTLRLVFLILAHDRPDHAIELARTLVAAGGDAHAYIHYDARAPAGGYAVLRAAAAAEPRIRLVERRVACPWGSFGLVEAPLNALAQVERDGLCPDYVMLLSGSCLPCRPVAALERYLTENAGHEFIEDADARWIGNGWRSERWQYRFWFDHKTQHPAEWLFFQAQRLLGLKRRFPAGLSPRFGSQWWTLSWAACQAILADIRRSPRRLDFFRAVWIPDEMVFQSYVHALVPHETIAGFGLTHFQFSNRGKPVVFYDDHIAYVRTFERFFFRKASDRAHRLRAECLARADGPDAGGAFNRVGWRRNDYQLKVAAQTHYPVPGQVFYRDQYSDMTDSVLLRCADPYVVLVGPPALTRGIAARIADRLPDAPFTVLGEVFDPDAVDLGARSALDGLGRGDVAIRDGHPALFLARLRARVPGVPVLSWSPLRARALLEAVLRDPNALIVACLPYTGDEDWDRCLLALACRADLPDLAIARVLLPDIAPERAWRAQVGSLAFVDGGWVDWLGSLLFYRRRGENVVVPESILPMPWTLILDDTTLARRHEFFDAALRDCRFRTFPWFSALAGVLTTALSGMEQGGIPDLFEDAFVTEIRAQMRLAVEADRASAAPEAETETAAETAAEPETAASDGADRRIAGQGA